MAVYALLNDYWHPSSVTRPGLQKALGEYDVVYTDDDNDIPWDDLSQMDALILMKGSRLMVGTPATVKPDEAEIRFWFTPQRVENLRRYVENGGAVLVMHSGLTGYTPENPQFELFGGHFIRHPAGTPSIAMVPCAEHEITKCISEFAAPDEHYFCLLAEEGNQLIFRAVSEHGDTPGGWVREVGKGRICCLVSGHTDEVFDQPDCQRLIRQALDWAVQK